MLNFGNTANITKSKQAAQNVIPMPTTGYLVDLPPKLYDKKKTTSFFFQNELFAAAAPAAVCVSPFVYRRASAQSRHQERQISLQKPPTYAFPPLKQESHI